MKKNPKCDIERQRNLYIQLGFIVSLALAISAFEWNTIMVEETVGVEGLTAAEDFVIPITKWTPPEPPKPKVVTQIIEVMEEEPIDDLQEFTFDEYELGTMEVEFVEEDLPDEVVDDQLYLHADDMPLPEGGYQAFYGFVGENLKYPRTAQRMNVEGKVFIQFVIDKKGNITEAQVIRGIGAGCDEEALRVINLAPQWLPGRQRGQSVRVRMVLPITFKLN
ncbi:MAG: energy transducer TonB [Cyclobacteriaceae bacterium]|nr:energy transducer TonB [Cyclobacteriaceae bacterium]